MIPPAPVVNFANLITQFISTLITKSNPSFGSPKFSRPYRLEIPATTLLHGLYFEVKHAMVNRQEAYNIRVIDNGVPSILAGIAPPSGYTKKTINTGTMIRQAVSTQIIASIIPSQANDLYDELVKLDAYIRRYVSIPGSPPSTTGGPITTTNNPKKYTGSLNQILFGPPGTGKTYTLLNEYIQLFQTKNEESVVNRFETVTFHQSYTYEDFIEGIKPVLSDNEQDGKLSYIIEAGIFKRMCSRAQKDPSNKYAIFIDEINRGNIAAIFGELITLIEDDKREKGDNPMSILLPYSKTSFSVPSNLYIIGTMNTADRSVEALDTALRRRFSFVEMTPSPKLIRTIGKSKGVIEGVDIVELLYVINRRIEKLLDKDHMIGHSYFLSAETLDDLKAVFQNKIIPLLQEYFFGDFGKMGLVLGEGFFELKKEESDEGIFAKFNDYDISGLAERKVYHLWNCQEMESESFIEALKTLIYNA